MSKKNCKIGTARHPLPVGVKYSRDPTTKGASPRSIIKCFFCTFCTLIVKLLGPSCLCLSQHWTLLEHARLAWLTFGSRRKKLPEEKNAWAWLTLGSQRKKNCLRKKSLGLVDLGQRREVGVENASSHRFCLTHGATLQNLPISIQVPLGIDPKMILNLVVVGYQ